MTEAIRLSRLMTERGLCSRREADRFIEQGLVSVDGTVVTTLGTKIIPTRQITLDPRAHIQQSQRVTVLINKPLGYVSGLPEKGYQSAVMLINKHNRFAQSDPVPGRHGLAPAGRLDIDSTGLMVFTRDGRVAKKIIAPHSAIEKEYLVRVQGRISSAKIELLQHGLCLDDKPLKRAEIAQLDHARLRFTLMEGRKRQIRRMCEQLDLKVTGLTRIRIGQVKLGRLGTGKWRLLRPGEYF